MPPDSEGLPASDAYIEALKLHRENQDVQFQDPYSSPLSDGLRAAFTGLNYYPLDQAWCIAARWERNPEPQPIQMARSDGESSTFVVSGAAKFAYQGKVYRLTAYQVAADEGELLFMPFRDATSGTETYGGGRYLEAYSEGESVLIDFNKAYNPYCAYDPTRFVCPLPPEANNLPIAVTAGEKAIP